MCAERVRQVVRIGVLAKRGPDICSERWQKTADYLNKNIENHHFVIIPLKFDQIDHAVQNGGIEFLLANPSIYVRLETQFSINRIATLKTIFQGNALNEFGGVFFTRSGRNDISKIPDLKGKRLSVVDANSMGGWHVGWAQMKKAGLDPEKNLKALMFAGTHDGVALMVADGIADAGCVRTDTLEQMHEEKLINISQFKILPAVTGNAKKNQFPLLLSTDLYPEWPLAKILHTSDLLAEKVAAQLLVIEKTAPAAKAAKIAGWSVPKNYQPVHELLKELSLPPYEAHGHIPFFSAVRQHAIVSSVFTGAFIVLVLLLIRQYALMKKLEQAREKLQQSSHRLSLATESIDIGVWEWDFELRRLFWDKQMHRIFQVSESEFNGRYGFWRDRVHPDDIEKMEQYLENAIKTDGKFDAEFRIILPSGEERVIRGNASTEFGDHRQPVRMIGANWDITSQKRMEEEIRNLAQRDPLTGAFNRRGFIEKSRKEIHRAIRYNHPVSILMLDIDYFKQVNDTYGHPAGDEVLKALTRTALGILRESDLFGRLGGEEFCALLVQNDMSAAVRVAERLRTQLATTLVQAGDHEIYFLVSIGVTEIHGRDDTFEEALHRADQALYGAKKQGRNRVVSG